MDHLPQEGLRPSKPHDVDTGVRLLYASFFLGIVKVFVDFHRLMALGPATLSLTLVVAILGLLLFVIIKISSGRNWARVVFLIGFIVGPVVGLYDLRSHLTRNPAFGWLVIVTDLLQIVALYFLFKPSSGAWFKSPTTAE